MRYVLLAICLIVGFGMYNVMSDDAYMKQTKHEAILLSKTLVDQEVQYVPYGTFKVQDQELKLKVSTEFYSTVKVGTKVNVPLSGFDLDFDPTKFIIHAFIFPFILMICFALSVILFILSWRDFKRDYKLYKMNKRNKT